MAQYNVILVDDHLLFAQSLARLIDTFENFKIVDVFRNGAELVDRLSAGMPDPDVLLLDINMPVMGGLQTMKWIKKYRPSLKVLALSMEDDERIIINMLRQGAKGYLLKDIQPEILEKALNAVVEHGYYHTELVTNTLMQALSGEVDVAKKYNLKENDIRFIELASQEKTYKEIADIMNLSPKTIDGYRQNLFDKFEVKNRIGLVMFALKNRIITLDD